MGIVVTFLIPFTVHRLALARRKICLAAVAAAAAAAEARERNSLMPSVVRPSALYCSIARYSSGRRSQVQVVEICKCSKHALTRLIQLTLINCLPFLLAVCLPDWFNN